MCTTVSYPSRSVQPPQQARGACTLGFSLLQQQQGSTRVGFCESALTIASSVLNRFEASALASSVLPTPVGPRNMKLAMGRLGSDRPALRGFNIQQQNSNTSAYTHQQRCHTCSFVYSDKTTDLLTHSARPPNSVCAPASHRTTPYSEQPAPQDPSQQAILSPGPLQQATHSRSPSASTQPSPTCCAGWHLPLPRPRRPAQ